MMEEKPFPQDSSAAPWGTRGRGAVYQPMGRRWVPMGSCGSFGSVGHRAAPKPWAPGRDCADRKWGQQQQHRWGC